MDDLSANRLLSFARKLQRALTFGQVLEVARAEVEETAGYHAVWMMVADDEPVETLRLLDFSGANRDDVWKVAPTLKVKGDAFLEETLAGEGALVIVDARTDPRTDKAIVERLQNRTLINVPFVQLDKPFGFMGIGTFGDEGCRAPTPEQVKYFEAMGPHLAVATSRVRLAEIQATAQKERRELEQRVAQVQKLESLGLLAGGIAHDFNNLITVILSGAAMAKREVVDPEVVEDLTAVIEAAERARDLTRQLLAMSRAQALVLRPVDLNAQLSNLLKLLRRLMPAEVQFDLLPGAHLPNVNADPTQLDQVFMNLALNARDAMPAGGRLTFETEQVVVNGAYTAIHPWAKAGRYVLVTVTDTGTGMTKETLAHMFEPFFTTKLDQQRGSGLGLAVAYGIVNQHQGMVHCYSELGVGTTFKVYLPCAERMAGTVGTKLLKRVPTGNEPILVADDDDAVRAMVVRILEGGGYQVTAVSSGDAAVVAACERTYGLVLLDVVMPGLPCAQTVKSLRKACPSLPILLASGYAGDTNISALIAETELELLNKPYHPDELLQSVRRVLDLPGAES